MIDLGDTTKPFNAKPKHEVDDLLNRGGAVGVIRYLGKRAFTSWVSYIVLATLIMGFGVSRSDSENISGKLINFDLFGAFKKAGEVSGGKANKFNIDVIANNHEIYKSAFAVDYLGRTTFTLSKKVKFKVMQETEFLVSKERYGASPFEGAANDCSYDFGPIFYPVSIHNLKLKEAGQRSWAGGRAFRCVAKIKYLN